MPKIKKKNEIEQCTKIFIYQDLKPSWQWKFNVDHDSHTILDTYTLYVGITPHKLVKSDFCEFILHSGRHSVSTVLKSYFKTKFTRDMTRGWIEGQF